MAKIYNNTDYQTFQLLNAKLQQLGSDITASGNEGIIFYNTASHLAKISNGTTIDTLTNLLESIAGSGAISVSAVSGKSQTVSVAAATGSVPGTMSAADFTKLGAATALNTASTLVLRDGSGNFAAGTITASLTGTASNATQLNSQAASFYLARANHTGTQLAATISDFDTQVRTSTINQLAAPTADFSMNTHKISNVVDPTSPQDVATKAYVDATAIGLNVKGAVRAGSTANVAAGTYNATGGTSGRGQFTTMPNTIDGVSLAANDRVLLKNQTTGAQNGIWVVTTVGTGANGVWDRATDFDQDAEVKSGAFTFITEGSTLDNTGWVLTTNNPITIGGGSGTAIAFAQFSSAGSFTQGNGILISGGTISAVVDTTTVNANSLSLSGTGITIATTYVGQASITTLGTIGTGTWQGTAVAVGFGGTGSGTAAGARANLSAATVFTSLLAGVGPVYTIAHGLTSANNIAQVKLVSTNEVVYPDVVVDATNVVITFGAAQVTNTFRVMVVGL